MGRIRGGADVSHLVLDVAIFVYRLPTPFSLLGLQVGDRLEVHFRNALTHLDPPGGTASSTDPTTDPTTDPAPTPTSPWPAVDLSPGGGRLLLDDGTDPVCAVGAGGVAPGQQCVYRWLVPQEAGPGPGGALLGMGMERGPKGCASRPRWGRGLGS